MTALFVPAYQESDAPPNSPPIAAKSPSMVAGREVALLRVFGWVIALVMLGLLAVMCLAEARINRSESSRGAASETPTLQASVEHRAAAS